MSIIIKNKEQIDGIRKASKLAARTLDYIETLIKPNVTTKYLNDMAADFMAKNGATSATLGYKHDGIEFPAEICTSINEVVCHGIPTNSDILKEGDIVKIDVTPVLNGYYGDICKTFAVGQISRKKQDLINVTEHCLNLGISQVRPGNRIGNIGHTIATYAHRLGYSVVYNFCGHGLGIDFHEPPQIPHIALKDTGVVMQAGMIFTIEPMINCGKPEVVIENDGWTVRTLDKKLSAQFEHSILVTDTGFEILTLS